MSYPSRTHLMALALVTISCGSAPPRADTCITYLALSSAQDASSGVFAYDHSATCRSFASTQSGYLGLTLLHPVLPTGATLSITIGALAYSVISQDQAILSPSVPLSSQRTPALPLEGADVAAAMTYVDKRFMGAANNLPPSSISIMLRADAQ